MNTTKHLSTTRRRTDATQREQLLAAYDRSELTATEFTRQHRLNYTTFCGWRQRRSKITTSPAFVQVEVAALAPPRELLIELGGSARLRLTSPDQLELAAALLARLAAAGLC